MMEIGAGIDCVWEEKYKFDLSETNYGKQIIQSKAESQQIAVWRLLYWIQHPDQ